MYQLWESLEKVIGEAGVCGGAELEIRRATPRVPSIMTLFDGRWTDRHANFYHWGLILDMRIDFIFLVYTFKDTTFPLAITYIQIHIFFSISSRQHNHLYIFPVKRPPNPSKRLLPHQFYTCPWKTRLYIPLHSYYNLPFWPGVMRHDLYISYIETYRSRIYIELHIYFTCLSLQMQTQELLNIWSSVSN